MLEDILTMAWKELKEILSIHGGRMRGNYTIMVFFIVFGVILPLQMGKAWVEEPAMLALWAWVPLFLVNGVIADSFAGERERHTLETLLSTRLSDEAILAGKVMAAVVYAWGQTLCCLFLGAVTATLAFGEGQVLFYSGGFFVGALLLGFLTACFTAGVGVLISLRAGSARQAQQAMSIAVLVILLALVYGPKLLPLSVQGTIFRSLTAGGIQVILLGGAGVLFVLASASMAAARTRFTRNRLILD